MGFYFVAILEIYKYIFINVYRIAKGLTSYSNTYYKDSYILYKLMNLKLLIILELMMKIKEMTIFEKTMIFKMMNGLHSSSLNLN